MHRAFVTTFMHRLWRWCALLVLLIALVPIPLALTLRIAEPPTTMLMLRRTLERYLDGKRPFSPQRQPIPLMHISPHLRRAVLVSEDARFYQHRGFDFDEIARAMEDHEQGKALRGASTISQQTAKNLFLWEGRSWLRKGCEVYLTLLLETFLGKDRILEIYLNLAEWGDGVFGAEMAAQTYFQKPAAGLSRDEAARLAAILPSPRRWELDDPVARRRARRILERMSPRLEP
jgi:monofunctional biosynthetic peptidoglycan transglycosylase